MGGDPQPGVRKRAVIDFRHADDAPIQRQYCDEGGRCDFAWQIEWIKYGTSWDRHIINDPEVYWRFTKACFEDGRIMVNNDNLGGL